jgi:hypothetical protein
VRIRLERKGLWLGVAGALLVVGALLIALPFAVQTRSATAGGAGRQPVTAEAAPAVASAAASETINPSGVAVAASALSPQSAPAASLPASSAASNGAASRSTALDAYRGLGMWVDIYDDRAWKDPAAAVADMAQHGVRTLYLETGNSRSKFAIKDPAGTAQFIQASHAHGMRVVAWYLPDTTDPVRDYNRVAKAIGFTTADGQKFDGFALDIESSAVKSESVRNRRLEALSTRIRALVGPSYALGAIIPSPVGLAKKAGYWDNFPYTAVARDYDVFLPMSYYTYHGKTASAAYADTRNNVRILRAQPGCATIPIHLIGGIAEDSSAMQVRSFVRGVRETDCFGASFYSWPGTTAAHWRELAAITP